MDEIEIKGGPPKMAIDQTQLPMATGEQEEVLHVVKVSNGKVVNASTLAQTALVKLRQIETELGAQLIERASIIADMMLALISAEHIFMYGPPGTAKSLLASALAKHIDAGAYFAWLLNKSSDPSDLLGPYSVKAMEKDKFLRKAEGRLPTAVIAFLDEIWKANNPILNIMLSILNERIFYNDGKAEPVPLITMFCASNEFPEDDSLKAIWDRIMFREDVTYIKDPANFIAMARSDIERRNPKINTKFNHTIVTLPELQAVHQVVQEIEFPDGALRALGKLKLALENAGIVTSDRRWVNCIKIMQAHAFYKGRKKVSSDDLMALKNCLWEKLEDISTVEAEIGKLINPFVQDAKKLLSTAQDTKVNTLSKAEGTARASAAVEAKVKYDQMGTQIEQIITNAKNEGVDTDELEKMRDQINALKEEVLNACLFGNKKAPPKPTDASMPF